MELFLSLLSSKVIAQTAPIVGVIDNPLLQPSYGSIDTPGKGLGLLLTNGLRLFFVVAGILTLFNLIISGFQYISSAGDPKTLQQAWNRISMSLVGLVLMVGSFVLAAIFGWLLFRDPLFMLRPTIYGPR